MIIGVIGYGVVGKATAEVFRRLGHELWISDTSSIRVEAAQAEGFRRGGQDDHADVVFLCVPEGNVRQALAAAPECPVTVIRSTVLPGTTDRLTRELGRPLAFVPEMLREATALWDALNPPFVLIGCRSPDQGRTLSQLFAPLLAPIVLVPPTTAEMVKLALNAYLHTLVSFWNEIHHICRVTGVESHVVGKLCSQDPRVSNYGATMHGEPVGGRCLPKDLTQLIAFAQNMGFTPDLLRAVQQVNGSLADPCDGRLMSAERHPEWPQLQVLSRGGMAIDDVDGGV